MIGVSFFYVGEMKNEN